MKRMRVTLELDIDDHADIDRVADAVYDEVRTADLADVLAVTDVESEELDRR